MAILAAGRIGDEGAIVEVRLEQTPQFVAALARRGLQVSQPVEVPALIDTGANRSALDRHVVAALDLEYRGTLVVHTPSTGKDPVELGSYGLRLTVGNVEDAAPGLVQVIEVVEADLAHLGYAMLIGRDILADCFFHYLGRNGVFRLES